MPPLCHICRRREANSKEHLPPRSVRNRGTVEIDYIDGKISNGVSHLTTMSPDGFWLRSLCAKCNNSTGSKLVGAYAQFVDEVAKPSELVDDSGLALVHLRNIYPRRIVKQMFSMFLSAQNKASLPEWDGLRRFVRIRDEPLPEGSPRVFLYMNVSSRGRIVPWCALSEIRTSRTPVGLSEISWPPLGIIFLDGADDWVPGMAEVTEWAGCRFSEQRSLMLRLPKLRVETAHPMGFGSAHEVDRWRKDSGVLWYVGESDDSESETSVAMTWAPRR